MPNTPIDRRPLSAKDWKRFEAAVSRGKLTPAAVHGLLVALATHPADIAPGIWVTYTLGGQRGAKLDEAATQVLLAALNDTRLRLKADDELIMPSPDDPVGLKQWCTGYVGGMNLGDGWHDGKGDEMVLPIIGLSLDGTTTSFDKAHAEKMRNHAEGCARQAYTYFKQSAAGAKEKIGRNEPCPCGSGKKYKRCCR